MFIIPAPGRTVRYPGDPSRLLPETGAEVPDRDLFWRRRLNQGDVLLVQEEDGTENAAEASGSEDAASSGTSTPGDEQETVENGASVESGEALENTTKASESEDAASSGGSDGDVSTGTTDTTETATATLSATAGKTKKSTTTTADKGGD